MENRCTRSVRRFNFDNAPYVEAGADVTIQLLKLLGADDTVSLLARDGDVLADMAG